MVLEMPIPIPPSLLRSTEFKKKKKKEQKTKSLLEEFQNGNDNIVDVAEARCLKCRNKTKIQGRLENTPPWKCPMKHCL